MKSIILYLELLVTLVGIGSFVGCDVPSEQQQLDQAAPRYAWEQPGRYVVAFTCDGCAACQRDKKHYGDLRASGIELIEINVDQTPGGHEIAAEYGVHHYPTYCVFEDGSFIDKVFTWQNLLLVLKALFWIASLLLL